MTLLSTALAAFLVAAAGGGKTTKLEQGQKAFNQGEFDAALRLLDQAASEAQDPSALEKVHLLRGQCFGARQDFARAEEAFALALEANPEAALDPARVDPSLVKVLDALRARTKGTLVIRSTPEGAELKLDGAPFGKAPKTEAVPIGRHKLEIQYAGAPAVTSEVVVRTRGVTSVEAVQAPSVAGMPSDAPTERKVRPFADVRGMFESGTPEGGLEVGGGIEVPWVRLAVMVRVVAFFEIIPRVSLVVPLPIPMPAGMDAKSIFTPHLSAFIEAEVPIAIDQAVGVGLGGAAGAEWGPWKWLGLYAQLGGRYFFTVYNSCCTTRGRFTASGGVRLRLP
jgi:hypothetical protein